MAGGATYYNEELEDLLRLLKHLPESIPLGEAHNFISYVPDAEKVRPTWELRDAVQTVVGSDPLASCHGGPRTSNQPTYDLGASPRPLVSRNNDFWPSRACSRVVAGFCGTSRRNYTFVMLIFVRLRHNSDTVLVSLIQWRNSVESIGTSPIKSFPI
ncbi:hypothetical protein DFH09DRAFT_1071773 [Mycena vulgaris]|nr:hypothetical protein DFH09DRAFT_1071773 [Mycena vulgaris]